MKITCQSCQSKYTVSDEKVQGKTVKIKCRKCGATILVNSGGVTTTGAGVADPASVSMSGSADTGGTTYLVNVADGDQRSMTLAELVAAYNSSVINADTYVWADGMSDWSPVSQVEAVVSALNAPAVAPSAPPPAASVPPPAAASPSASVAGAAAEPEHRAAARRDPARRGAADLFSGRPAEEAVATSAPSYSNGSSNGSVSPPKAAGLPGQREENSMLFSLSALTAKAGTGASPSSAPSALAPRVTTAKDREDSGIIDLKALAAAAAATSAPAQPSTSSFLPDTGLFPLGAPVTSSPIAAPPVVSSTEAPPAKNKTPIFIGVGAVVAVGAIVGAFMFMKGGAPPPAPAPAATAETTTTAEAAPPPPVTATPTAVETATAAPTATASAVAVAKGGGAPRSGGGGAARGGGGAAKGPAAPAGGGAGAAAPPPPPKKGGCGCAPGDLMCAMKCSAH